MTPTADREAARSAAARTDCPDCAICTYSYTCEKYPRDCGFIRDRQVPKRGTCARCGRSVAEPFVLCPTCEERERFEVRAASLGPDQQTLGGFA